MPNAPSIDLTEIATDAMIARGLIPSFSPEILNEVEKLHPPKLPISGVKAKDLRDKLWFSVDNDDSKDLDQLTYAEKLPHGEHSIYIAVADVDILVKRGTAIDERAKQNTTSVYTPTKNFPMLPDRLSTDLTSLNPNKERLSMVFEGHLKPDGTLKEGKIYLAYVHSKAQLAYDGVSDWLDGKANPPAAMIVVDQLPEQVALQDEIAKKLGGYRHEIGALSIETIEPHTELLEGLPVAITAVKKNRARGIIENFMIVANMISARYTDSHKLLSLRRVVTVPRRWDKIIEVARERGTDLPTDPDAKSLETFLVAQKQLNPSSFPDLSLTIVKLLGRGEYRMMNPRDSGSKDALQHFGLALRDYSHSTAPNRRYPDLITQRILLASLRGEPEPYTKTEMEMLAAHCTDKENEADKIERRLKKCAAAIVLSDSIGKEFSGIVTGANESDRWVRIFEPPVEGKLVKGGKKVDVGDHIRVKLIYTDPRAGFIDFSTE